MDAWGSKHCNATKRQYTFHTDLAAVPRAAGLLGGALHVSSGEVHADSVREHVLQRIPRGDAPAACRGPAAITVVFREVVGGGRKGDGTSTKETVCQRHVRTPVRNLGRLKLLSASTLLSPREDSSR